MPGGIGRVSETMLSACSQRDRAISSVKNANEIFFHLDGRRVYYDPTENCMYFVDAPQDRVKRTIRAVFAGMGHAATIEQLHLDTHRFFNGARRVGLTADQADAVLIALRLSGIPVTIGQTSA